MKIKDINLSKQELDELEFIREGATYFANENGVKRYDILLQIDKMYKGLISFVYGNDLLEIMDVDHINSYMGHVMLAGAILTKQGIQVVDHFVKEMK